MTFRHDTCDLHFSITGTGAPLLLAPVPWGVDGHRWRSLDALADQFTLIRLDPRGTGSSGPVTQKDEYSIATLVRDIDALRAHLGYDRWHMMGQSAAGFTAMEYTLAFPSRIDRLIVVCSSPTGKFQKNTFRDPSHPLYPQYEALMQRIRTLPADQRVKEFNQAVYQFDTQTEESRRTIAEIFAQADFDAKRNQYFSQTDVARYDVTSRLHEITAPTLVIGGSHDVHVSPEWSRVIASGIPHSHMVTMERSGHFPWLDEEANFMAEVRSFLNT